MRKFFARFSRNRRGAIALIFAACLLPLVMLIGLSIDYSFYVQARSQFALSADAAATYALREATAAYTLENSNSNLATSTTAAAAAVTVGQTAGSAWFTVQLATLPTAHISSGSPTVTLTANTEASSSDPQGFTATVSYVGLYPPFFNKLFQRTSNWTVTGTSGATSQFAYVELLILMDTSGSMLVSADPGNNNTVTATNPGGILTMDDNSVCVPNSTYISSQSMSVYTDPASLITWSDVQNTTNTGNSSATSSVTCKSGMNNPGGRSNATAGSPYAPCAFACHTTSSTYLPSTGFTYVNQALTSTTAGTYTQDLYGLARQLGVKLKTDVVFQSVETIIQDMNNVDLAPDQFSIGIYSFDNDVCPIVNGNTDGAYATGSSGGSTVSLKEATTDLSGALTAVRRDDYTYTPTETAFPAIVPDGNGGTNFPLSVSDLIYGTITASPSITSCATTHSALVSPLTTSTVGTASINPEKDVFIVTDGMEDQRSSTYYASSSSPNGTSNTCGRVLGEMTGITAETNVSTTACDAAVCEPLKKLGFTVYVLQITYPAVENTYYYQNLAPSDLFVANDFSSLTHANGGTVENWNTGYTTVSSIRQTTLATPAPNEQALQACASSGDYYQASSSTSISTAMTNMLKSALDSAIRITQ